MFRSLGTLVYDPKLKSGSPSGAWWLIVECCRDLLAYYFATAGRLYGGRCTLLRPAWGSHVTVVRGEEPPNKAEWGYRGGAEVQFDHSPELQTDDAYWWLTVRCDELAAVRKRLGLRPVPEVGFHLTVATAGGAGRSK